MKTNSYSYLVSFFIVILFIFCITPFTALAADFESSSDGDWNIGTTWGGDCTSSCIEGTDYPGSNDNVAIYSSVSLSDDQSVHNNIIEDGQLNLGSHTLTVSGDWINRGSFDAGTGSVIFDGTTQNIIGTNSFYNLIKSITSAAYLLFSPTSTTTVTNNLSLSGIAGSLLTLQTSTSTDVYPEPIFAIGENIGMGGGQFNGLTHIARNPTTGSLYINDLGNARIQNFNSSEDFIRAWGFPEETDGGYYEARGVAVDSSGNVYVADQNQRVRKFDSNGNFLNRIGQGLLDNQIYAGGKLTIDSVGNVYVYDIQPDGGQIKKYDANGDFILAFPKNTPSFSSSASITTDSADNVYITLGTKVVKYSNTGTKLLEFGTDGTADGQFRQASGIAVNATGQIYVSDLTRQNVQKFSSTGTYISKFSLTQNTAKRLAIDSQGNLLILSRNNSGFQKYDADGNYINQTSFGFARFAEDLAVDANDNIYALNYNDNRVEMYDSDLSYLGNFGSVGGGDGQFQTPRGITINHTTGDIYIADINSRGFGRIQKFDSSNAFVSSWGDAHYSLGQFNNPNGVAVDSNDNLYVVDTSNNRIQKFNSSGTPILEWGTQGSGDGEFDSPSAIAIGPTDVIYVSDNQNTRIQKFNSSGNFIGEIQGNGGAGDGEFSSVPAMTTDEDGNLYIVDDTNQRIQKFTSALSYAAQFGNNGPSEENIYYPGGIVSDQNGHIYVTDSSANLIYKYSTDGTFIHTIGHPDPYPYQISVPESITTDSDGNFYATDSILNKVVKFNSNGTYVTSWGTQGNGDGEFDSLIGITADSSNNIYVTDCGNNRIQKFTSSGVFISSIGASPELDCPYDVAVDTSGYIYATSPSISTVSKYAPNGTYMFSFGSPGTGDDEFDNMFSVDIGPDNNLYISNSPVIKKFDTSGNFISTYSDVAPNITLETRGIAFDTKGQMYITSVINSSIIRLDSNGTYAGSWNKFNTEYITEPRSISIVGDSLYVVSPADYNYIGTRIYKYQLPQDTWKLNVTGTTTASYLSVANSRLYNSASPINCTDCTDLGGNQNWRFPSDIPEEPGPTPSQQESSTPSIVSRPRSGSRANSTVSSSVTSTTRPATTPQPTSDTPTVTSSTTNTADSIAIIAKIQKNIYPGARSSDVKALQIFLNNNGYVIAKTGDGSLGKETDFFGRLTYLALVRFQKDKKIPATGNLGPLTRAAIAKYKK